MTQSVVLPCASCRLRLVSNRQYYLCTAQANQIRGLLTEYGIVIPVGINNIPKRLPDILEDGENDLPGVFRQLLQRLGDHLKELDRQVDELSGQIQLWHKENKLSFKLVDIPGIEHIMMKISATFCTLALHPPLSQSRQLCGLDLAQTIY